MKDENRELLLRDLCSRLPYKVKVNVKSKIEFINTLCSIDIDGYCEINDDLYKIDNVTPYLLPLSSMTEEQQIELTKFVANGIMDENIVYDWYNKYHFDYRGLIPMGLANDATGLNIY